MVSTLKDSIKQLITKHSHSNNILAVTLFQKLHDEKSKKQNFHRGSTNKDEFLLKRLQQKQMEIHRNNQKEMNMYHLCVAFYETSMKMF